MLTRKDLAELSRAHETDLVLSVYLPRESSDPGRRGAWRIRLEGELESLRADIESESPEDLPAFDRAARAALAAADGFGRVLPDEGWMAFATAEGELCHSESLSFAPPDLVRWRQGVYAAPYLRGLKHARPITLALLDNWHARIYRYLNGELTRVGVLEADRDVIDGSDVGVTKRASAASGMRGATATDYAQRTLDEEARRFRGDVRDTLLGMVDGGGVALGGTQKSIRAMRKELEDKLGDQIADLPELSFDSSEEEIGARASAAASSLTEGRQARLLETCAESGRGSLGWNESYRALAAGAVDTLFVARGLIESAPDDAERLTRLALAQGSEIEELGGELGTRLLETDGVAARLRYRVP